LTDSFISVSGKVSNVSNLLVNGQKILADGFGNFEKSLLLARGYNIIELLAEDKFGRVATKKLEVVFK